jgi:NADH:ubiquinone oxidoreductase subunit C
MSFQESRRTHQRGANRQQGGGESVNSEIESRLNKLPGAGATQKRPDGIWMDAAELDVMALAELMKNLEARLTTITAISIENGETELIYHFAVGGEAINVRTRTRANAVPSIANVYKAANWAERENHDLFGVNFTGHPNLKRLIRPPQLAEGFFRQPGGAAGKALRGEENAL